MRWIFRAAALIWIALPVAAFGAQCKVGDEWYDYSHPKCDGGSDSGQSQSDSPPTGGPEFVQWEIERHALVRGTDIDKTDDEITLVVAMNAAVNQRTARQVGEKFVRMYITFSDEETGDPGKKIGKTRFDYYVAIIDSQRNILHSAAKIAPALDLNW